MSFLFGGGAKVQQPQATAALTIQQSSYGTPVFLLYGTNRIYGNMLWYGAFQAILVSTGGGGGKGGVVGGGGKGGGQSEYNYYATFAIGLCEGPISAVGDVYVSKQITTLAALGNATVFTGTQGQAQWGWMVTNEPAQSISYSELAYIGFESFSLGTSSETPQFSFEIFGLKIFGNGIQDASPDQVFIDFLTRAGIPAAYIDTFTALKNYCQSMGFFISPLFDQQQQASQWLKQIMDTLNSEFVWLPSQGILTAVPYGTTAISGNGAAYVPNLTPIYSLTDDDYIREGDEDPVTITRTELSDVYNQVPVEYVNSSDQYNVETYTAFDDGLTDIYGFRIAPTLQAHHVTNANEAQQMATLYLNRQIYIRNSYSFKTAPNYCLLDPMDLIEISDPSLPVSPTLVRIVSIQEDEKSGTLTFTCEDVPGAIAGAALNPNFGVVRSTPNYNQPPGDVNVPPIFESPLQLVQSAAVEINVGISGANPLWGGCQVWISTDNVTYQYLSEFNLKSRMGTLTQILPAFTIPPGGSSLDTIDTLAITMVESGGALNGAASQADAQALNTLCYVDGEFICYGQDNLTGPNAYNLSYLVRACYGSTSAQHAVGSKFCRMDANVFSYEANQFYVGQTIYFKFLSYNLWGGGLQTLDEVPAYNYTITGAALLTPLANPTGFCVYYTDNVGQLNWQPITDVRSPILYQIRKGASFQSAQIVGETTSNGFSVYGTDTYWVTAVYYTPTGTAVYSASPPSIAVVTAAIPQYLIETWDEASTSWSGTLSGSAVLISDTIEVNGSSNLLDAPNILTIPNILNYAAAAGLYTAPSGHTIASNYIINAKVIIDWALEAESSTSDVTALTDVTTTPDITGAAPAATVLAIPQIRLSQDGGSTWSEWQNWVPGFYTFNAIQYQIIIYSLALTTIAILTDLSITVDVPLRTDSGSSTSSAIGDTTVTYPAGEFNQLLLVAPQVVGGSSGDNVVIVSQGLTNFVYSVYNAGARVARTVSYTAQGY